MITISADSIQPGDEWIARTILFNDDWRYYSNRKVRATIIHALPHRIMYVDVVDVKTGKTGTVKFNGEYKLDVKRNTKQDKAS